MYISLNLNLSLAPCSLGCSLSLSVCMYVCMYVCMMYVCRYVCMSVWMYVCPSVRLCLFVGGRFACLSAYLYYLSTICAAARRRGNASTPDLLQRPMRRGDRSAHCLGLLSSRPLLLPLPFNFWSEYYSSSLRYFLYHWCHSTSLLFFFLFLFFNVLPTSTHFGFLLFSDSLFL